MQRRRPTDRRIKGWESHGARFEVAQTQRSCVQVDHSNVLEPAEESSFLLRQTRVPEGRHNGNGKLSPKAVPMSEFAYLFRGRERFACSGVKHMIHILRPGTP
jgi:hypothetical protein